METSTYRTAAYFGLRAAALIGILPGSIVAAAYLLVLTRQLYQHWDARTALVLGMAAWGVVGAVTLWHEYVRLSRARAEGQATPVSPRVVLCAWALLLVAFAAWKADEHPWIASFLALVALYSFGRAFGLLRYRAHPPAAPGHASVAGASTRARARAGLRSRALSSPPPSSRRASS